MTAYRDRQEAGEYKPRPRATLPADLGEWTKDELLAEARRLEVPANASMSKAEIREAIEAA